MLFNALALLLPVLAANTIIAAFTTSAITNPNSIEARTETRAEIDKAFEALRLSDTTARQTWASRIDQMVTERAFSAARGYLLAAPQMLNEDDARAVRAAAATEESGTQDQRIVRAALLFLPDNVRANYQRAVSPPPLPAEQPTEAINPENASATEVAEETSESVPSITPTIAMSDLGAALPTESRFSILGDTEDLVRRSQSWLGGSGVDDVQLRLRALGLMSRVDQSSENDVFEEGVTVLLTARRASRLDPRFDNYLRTRVEDALPAERLRQQLTLAFEPVLTFDQRSESIIDDYRSAIEPEALERLKRDMQTIATLTELTSTTGAVTLVEQTRSPEDMRRILLVARAGGDRAVALTRELGPNTLRLAQIGVKWTMQLVLQIMAIAAIGVALIMTMLSTITRAETLSRSMR
ncbi:MAG: hypothetical protein AAGB16_07185 [Pseudomonadota bacterium]